MGQLEGGGTPYKSNGGGGGAAITIESHPLVCGCLAWMLRLWGWPMIVRREKDRRAGSMAGAIDSVGLADWVRERGGRPRKLTCR